MPVGYKPRSLLLRVSDEIQITCRGCPACGKTPYQKQGATGSIDPWASCSTACAQFVKAKARTICNSPPGNAAHAKALLCLRRYAVPEPVASAAAPAVAEAGDGAGAEATTRNGRCDDDRGFTGVHDGTGPGVTGEGSVFAC